MNINGPQNTKEELSVKSLKEKHHQIIEKDFRENHLKE